MNIKKLIVKNFKALKDTEIEFNSHLNIIVGDNEVGKSTLLEAINLVLSGQLNGRGIQYEINPHYFNKEAIDEYLKALKDGQNVVDP